ALAKGSKASVDEARGLLTRGVELAPGDARLVRSLALVEARAGRRAEAEACLRRRLGAGPRAGPADPPWDLAELLIDRGARDEADDLIARLRDAALPAPLLDFLDARALAGRGRWREAAAAAERARPGLRDRADLSVRADLLLGLCCERLGD